MKDIFETDEPFDPDSVADGAVVGDDWGDDDDPFEDPNFDLYALKWICDGAKTLDEVAGALQAHISMFMELKVQGWELETPVENGHVAMRRAVSDVETTSASAE